MNDIPCAQTSEERDEFLMTLSKLSALELPPGDHCPVCLNAFSYILEEEKRASGTPKDRLGVTKLKCGHIFCMADIAEWIHTSRGSCPTCRDLFLIIPEPSDDESSDGGEYIPGSDSVADDMMDGETWTDEDGEGWTDGENMSLDDGITEGETDSSWERSSDAAADIDEEGVPVASQLGQTPMDTAVITDSAEASFLTEPTDDPECQQVKAELIEWMSRIDRIQMQDWASNKDGTGSSIRDGFRALRNLKPRIDAMECDTVAKASFVHAALAAVQEIHREIELKLDMMHDVEHYLSRQGEGV